MEKNFWGCIVMTNMSKVIAGIVGTLLIGAFGSGLWDIIFSPFFSWLFRAMLSFITLGLDTVRDSIYQDAAQGYQERPSIFLLNIVSGSFMGVVIVLWGMGWPVLAGRKGEKSKANSNKPASNIALVLGMLYLTFIAAVFFGVILIFGYTSNAVAHFHQSLAVIRPYTNEQQEEVFLSRYASIKTKNDYVLIIEDMQAIAKENSRELPEFEIW